MNDIKAIKAAAEAATPQPWIDPGEGNMPFICMMTPATVIALCDEIERLTACLKKANDQAEHFEREWYLRGDEIERLRADSARYQWLREQNADEPGKLGVFRYEQMGTCVSEFEPVWVGADIDAAIDAAMEAMK